MTMAKASFNRKLDALPYVALQSINFKFYYFFNTSKV